MSDSESGGEGRAPGRARVFDARKASLVCISLVVVIFVAVASSGGFAEPPPEFSTSTATPPQPLEDGLPHFHKYAYVFVAYDRSGYAVADELNEQLQKTMAEQKGHGKLKEQYIDSRSQFNAESLCPDLNLESNTVTILEAPEFHCNMQKLRALFMNHKDHDQEKYGVKVIHLVRNPFSMAVANYQDRKSRDQPEEVRFKNPCNSLTQDFSPNVPMTVADLNSPILEENGIMTREDFGNIWSQCNGMYQTQPGLETASYQQHLEKLPPAGGLRMAMADGVNNIALMASDLITFKHVHELVLSEHSNPDWKKHRHFGLMTLTMDEILNYPGNSMMEFMDFIFGEGISANNKRNVATAYENRKSVEKSPDTAETEKLTTLLRNDPIVGEPLGRVESLLESVLSEPMES